MQFPSLFLNPPKESNQNFVQQSPFSQQNYDNNAQQSKFGQGVYCTCNLAQNQQSYNSPYQQAPFGNGQRNDGYGGFDGSPGLTRHFPGCTPLPQNVADQLRSYSSASTPIIILPNGPPPSNPCPPCVQPSFIPYPVPPSIYQSFTGSERQCKCSNDNSRSSLCELCSKTEKENSSCSKYEYSSDSWGTQQQQQQRNESSENTGCSKKNCPAAIQLQAMISQLMGIQGVIPAAVVRVLLKVIPTSNVNETEEKIMEQASRSLRNLSKEQLLKESKSSQEIDKLLSLYLTSSTTLAAIIPVLTNAQLKTNCLRGQVEALVNAWVMQDQGCATEAPEPLEALLLELKSDEEIRQLLAALRDKECEERVNLNFAVYRSQRLVAQTRLGNVQKKIQQVESEINRRRRSDDQLIGLNCRNMRFCKVNGNSFGRYLTEQNFESPDPFEEARSTSPKRLFLKPHVGSPETTYTKLNHTHKLNCSGSDIPKHQSSSTHTSIKCFEDATRHTSATSSCVKKSNLSAKSAKKITISNDEQRSTKNNCNDFKMNEERDEPFDKGMEQETFLCEIHAQERHSRT